jgi:hypothetical protein
MEQRKDCCHWTQRSIDVIHYLAVHKNVHQEYHWNKDLQHLQSHRKTLMKRILYSCFEIYFSKWMFILAILEMCWKFHPAADDAERVVRDAATGIMPKDSTTESTITIAINDASILDPVIHSICLLTAFKLKTKLGFRPAYPFNLISHISGYTNTPHSSRLYSIRINSVRNSS